VIKETGPPSAKHQTLLALVRRARTVLSALGKDLPNTTLILALTALLVEEAQAATKSDAAGAADAAKKANKSLEKSDKESDEKTAER
jgi:hypothetical protein